MSFGFVEIINRIEAEIKSEYLPDAIRWADENHDGAWSKSIDRFEHALSLAIERKDYTSLRIEGEFYKQTVLGLLAEFKRVKGIADAESFLESVTALS